MQKAAVREDSSYRLAATWAGLVLRPRVGALGAPAPRELLGAALHATRAQVSAAGGRELCAVGPLACRDQFSGARRK